MKIVLILLLLIISSCNCSLANEIKKEELITLPIKSDGIRLFQEQYTGKSLRAFFSEYGKSSKVGGSDISIFYYKSLNNQTILVGSADLKTILYMQLLK